MPPPGGGPSGQGSPLVVDLDGDGIELYARGDYGTYFDLRGNGQAVLTGWVEPDDGLLAIDANENGVIDDVSELFGSLTTQGFTELAGCDTNADGVIDASDTDFADLLIWTDTNSDGVSQAAELQSLSDLLITEISLDATRVHQDIAGNTVTHTADFTIDGNTQTIVDAWFAFDPHMTRNVADYDFDIRAAFLPTLRAHGDLDDLHIAASVDNGTDPGTLMEQLIAFTNGMDFADALANWDTTAADIEAMLLRWADIEAVSPTGRGEFVDGQHLAFYESYTGEAFEQYDQPDPLREAGDFVEAIYDHILTVYGMHLITQAAGGEIFDDFGYSLYTGGVTGDMNLQQTGIDAIKDAAIADADAVAVWTRFAQFLGYNKGLDNLTASEITALDTAVAATGEPSLGNWQDVESAMVATHGQIIDSSDDWGSFEVYYDNFNIGTSGADVMVDDNADGYHDNEFLGMGGDDLIQGLDGHDKLSGGYGNDTLEGGTGDDYLLGGPGDDIYLYESGNDTISEVNGGGHDELHIMASTGLTQSDLVDLFRFDDELILLLSTDDYITVHGYNGTDTRIEEIVFDYDSSVIDLTTITTEKFSGTEDFDDINAAGNSIQTLSVYGYGGNDVLQVTGSAGEIYGGDGYDTLIGDYLPDELRGETQDDYLLGNGGDDTLYGGSGDDTLEGGADNDQLEGGGGDDVYIFGTGYGQDTVSEGLSGSANDKVLMNADVLSGNVTVTREADHSIKLSIDGTTDSILLYKQEHYTFSQARVEQVMFSDDTIWSDDDLRLKAIDTASTSGDDSIYGFHSSDDILEGGAGNDIIRGFDGDDTYIYNIGDGTDVIWETGGTEVIQMGPGISATDLQFVKNNNDLEISLLEQANSSITIKDYYYWSFRKIENISFYDGSEMDLPTGTTIDGTSNADLLIGTSRDETINGLAGNDLLAGGQGTDTLIGGDGDDNYRFNLGDGSDTINDSSGTGDQISFSAGIRPNDLVFADVDVYGLEIAISGTTDKVTIHGQRDGAGTKQIEWLKFDDGSTFSLADYASWAFGTTGADNPTLTSSADYYWGDDGDDTLTGGDGDDELAGGNGADTIEGGADDDLISGGDGNDTLYGDNDSDIIYGGDGDDIIEGGNHNDTLIGGSGVDRLYGESGTDIFYDVTDDLTAVLDWSMDTGTWETNDQDQFIGGTGHNVYYQQIGDGRFAGNTGNDHYHMSFHEDGTPGSRILIQENSSFSTGDTVYFDSLSIDDHNYYWTFGLNDSFYGGAAGASDLTLHYTGTSTTTQVKIYSEYNNSSPKYTIDYFQFADSAVIHIEDMPFFIKGTSGADSLNGDSEANYIVTYDGGDDVDGGAGDDFIGTGNGDDTIYGGDGNDSIKSLNGNDTIYGGTGNDYIDAADGNKTIYGGSGDDTISLIWDGDDKVYGEDGNDIILGHRGNDLLSGGDGNDTLSGSFGNDILDGGAGDDEYTGGGGDDLYRYQSGLDEMQEGGNGGVDVIHLEGEVTVNDISVSNYGNDETKIIVDEGVDEIIVDHQRHGNSNHHIESLSFDDGFITDQFTDYNNWLNGTTSGDVIAGNGNDNVLIGKGGNDDIDAGAGNDDAHGGTGDDSLDGEDGNDLLHGGDGTDTLSGGAGADTLYGGDGADTLHGDGDDDILYGTDGLDTLYGDTGADTFVFTDDSAFNDIDVVKDFDVSTDNDVLDIADILTANGYEDGVDAITDWVEITTNGSDSDVKVDITGTGTFGAGTQITTLEGITGLTDEAALVSSGNLIAA